MIECRADYKTFKCTHCGKWFLKDHNTHLLTVHTPYGFSQNIGIFCSTECKQAFEATLHPTINNTGYKNATSRI